MFLKKFATLDFGGGIVVFHSEVNPTCKLLRIVVFVSEFKKNCELILMAVEDLYDGKTSDNLHSPTRVNKFWEN